MITQIIYMFAFLCFVAGAFRAPWVDWKCLGFAFLVLSLLVK